MVDNVAVTPGTGATFATDDIGGIQYPRVKVTQGADGAAVDVSSAAPLQVTLANGTVPSHAVTNAGTFAVQATLAEETTKNIGTIRVGDGTDTAAVLPASTAPVATDTALVVAISPNGQNANGQATMANSTPVTIASNQTALSTTPTAGELHLGEVGGKSAVVSVTLSTDTSAYASGDLIADTQQIDAFFRKTDGTGVINSITIIDEDNQGAAFYIVFMSTSTSLGTENSAPNISDANLTAGLQGIIAVATSDYVTLSGAKVATIKNIGLPVKAVSGTDDIYIAVLNATGTPTFTASGLEMRIGVLLD